MSGSPGYLGKISVSTAIGGAYTELPGTAAAFDRARAALNDTELDTNAGWESFVAGLKSFTSNDSLVWSASHAGIAIVETAYNNNSDLFVQVLVDGTNGHKGQVQIAAIAEAVAKDGIVTYGVTFQGTGAVTAVP